MFENYQPLSGSERKPGPAATFLRPVDPNETFSVTIVLRRRPDGPPAPSQDYFCSTAPSQRRQLSADEFGALYGASPDDVAKVIDFAKSHGLQVTATHLARRTVVVSGTAAQMSAAFRVNLGHYRHSVIRRHGQKPQTEDYRGRDGMIQVPAELSQIIVGVFGLDNRRITKHNGNDPPNTQPVSVATLRQLYDFPTNSATGQTIAILSEDGYLSSDIRLAFGGNPPTVTDVSVDAGNSGRADGETTQDICIAGLAAPGAQIAVYFTTPDQKGWVDLISRVAHPDPGDPVCNVLSSSFYVSNGDDAATLANEGVSTAWVNAMTMAFQDAGVQHVTVCIACGDTGTNSKVGDGKAHVQYPGSDPWVLSVGGTTVGNITGSTCDEYVWNDPNPSDPSHWGTTGGGVSDFFKPFPPYQSDANVPPSLNDNHIGRGVPDVAANASLNAGYSGLYLQGEPFLGNGTSASAPLWAGLIAVINAAIGQRLGFINPALYTFGTSVFRSIYGPPGPTDNSNGGVPGYPATGPGWNACTGWGSPNGKALCQAFILYNSQGSNFKRASGAAFAPSIMRNAAECVAVNARASAPLPQEILSRLRNASVKQFSGTVNSIVTQPPFLSLGIYNQQENKIQGFVIPDTTDKSQACTIKAIFVAFESKSLVNVYYTDPGSAIYAIVISAT